MKKYKCTWGNIEQIICCNSEDEAREEFVSSLVSDEELNNFYFYEDLRFETKVQEILNIEVGKCYLSRDGRKCFVYSKPKCLNDTFLFSREEFPDDVFWETKLDTKFYQCDSSGNIYKDYCDNELKEIFKNFDLVEEI